MKNTSQKINLMSSLTAITSGASTKILEDTSIKNKELKKMVDSISSKKNIFHKNK